MLWEVNYFFCTRRVCIVYAQYVYEKCGIFEKYLSSILNIYLRSIFLWPTLYLRMLIRILNIFFFVVSGRTWTQAMEITPSR